MDLAKDNSGFSIANSQTGGAGPAGAALTAKILNELLTTPETSRNALASALQESARQFERLLSFVSGTFYRSALVRPRIMEFISPGIAAITGYALGGGFELALCCDFRLAGATAKVGFPEITLGVIPGMGGTQRAARLVGPSRAKEIVFSGRFIGADEALAMGLVNQVVPEGEDVYAAARAWASRYVGGPAMAYAAAKQVIDRGLEVDLATGLEIERMAFASLFATEDQKIGMAAFVAKEKPTFTGR